MESPYNTSSMLVLRGFDIPPEGAVPAFLFASLSYMIILFCNLLLIFTIVLNKSLRRPMYLLLLNMPVNDLLGSSAFFLQLIKELASESGRVWHPSCVAQAFFIHIYASGTVLILSAMAYDRYLAICLPLKYHAVMTNGHVVRIIAAIWLASLLMIGALFFLLLRLPRCRSTIHNVYCDNPSLLSLVCADTTVNHAYGLFVVAVTQLLANGVIVFTYLRILVACFRSRQANTKAKALQTCATHLFVFLLLEFLGLFTIISYRVKHIPPTFRRFMGSSTLVFPPSLNPIIYGIKTKEIRDNLVHFFRSRITKSCVRLLRSSR
ncbi:olfactory receptor 52B2-like [Syngnathoides biaculeatus]|uniref:olfactory receptor 52B2-like n=1 Tax=Syngnathoides biaculeatus TaxID=300417 RepID=UPI002ADDF460|nr:olfactory receptor 52B2-like [Syngnathoides biaculeatus]